MNKKITIYILAAMVLTACSRSDGVLDGLPMNEVEFSDGQMTSDVPIAFAPVKLADTQWEVTAEVEPTRGGSVGADDFTIDSLGIFCMAKKKLAGGPTSINFSWGSNYSQIPWVFNEMAEVKGIGENKGTIKWEKQSQLYFYPKTDYYTYGFIAYHPWTKYVVKSSSSIKAYIKVDGNDDVIHAIAAEPEARFGDGIDALAFSRSYFDEIRNQGLSWEGTYPKFQFQHLMSRLDFSFCFDENDLPNRNLHVDKVEFNDFPCLMTLPLASLDATNGVMTNPITPTTILYVLNSNKDQIGKLMFEGDTLKNIDAQFASAFGHFELREKGEIPISGIREGSNYKYNLTSEFKKVGDCILIPPVKNNHSKRNIKLLVTLSDDNGHKYRNKTAITLNCPTDGWGWNMGTCYDVRIVLSNPLTHGVSNAPAFHATSSADGNVTLWNPNAKVTINPRK